VLQILSLICCLSPLWYSTALGVRCLFFKVFSKTSLLSCWCSICFFLRVGCVFAVAVFHSSYVMNVFLSFAMFAYLARSRQ